jgi:uncharacterized protein (TIGR04255 family)
MSSEVYPHAPVSFIAFVVQFPFSPRLEQKETKEAVYDRLADTFPLFENVGGVSVEIQLGGSAVGQPPAQAPMPEKARMMNRERTRSVTLGPRMIAVEGTEHSSFEHLRELLDQVLQALVDVAAPSGMSLVRLQYVDEIRHPSVRTPADWKGLVADSLLGPTSLAKLEAQQAAGVAVYQVSEQHQLRLGYGAAPVGFAVDPGGPLRVDKHESGPFFRLNIESEWTAPEEAVPPLTVKDVLAIADTLHDAVSNTFEDAITPALREHFRRTDGDG